MLYKLNYIELSCVCSSRDHTIRKIVRRWKRFREGQPHWFQVIVTRMDLFCLISLSLVKGDLIEGFNPLINMITRVLQRLHWSLKRMVWLEHNIRISLNDTTMNPQLLQTYELICAVICHFFYNYQSKSYQSKCFCVRDSQQASDHFPLFCSGLFTLARPNTNANI